MAIMASAQMDKPNYSPIAKDISDSTSRALVAAIASIAADVRSRNSPQPAFEKDAFGILPPVNVTHEANVVTKPQLVKGVDFDDYGNPKKSAGDDSGSGGGDYYIGTLSGRNDKNDDNHDRKRYATNADGQGGCGSVLYGAPIGYQGQEQNQEFRPSRDF